VFVPLFSPEYVTSPPRDSELFLDDRETAVGRNGRVQPVLWVPLPPGTRFPHLMAALELGGDLPEYAQQGLSAMSRLRKHAHDYDKIVRRLAGRIITAAEHPAPVAPGDQAVRDALPPRSDTSFIVAVIAPSESRIAVGRD